MTLTIEQRDYLLKLLPHYEQRPVGRKRADTKQVFAVITWVMESGARWQDSDKHKYGVSYQTCHRYFQEWVRADVWREAWRSLAREMEDDSLLEYRQKPLLPNRNPS